MLGELLFFLGKCFISFLKVLYHIVELGNFELKGSLIALVVGEVIDLLGRWHLLWDLPDFVITSELGDLHVFPVSVDIGEGGGHHLIDDSGTKVTW